MGHSKATVTFLVAICFVGLSSPSSPDPYRWMQRDNFDDLDDKFVSVNAQNCRSKRKENLMFPDEAVSQKPQYNHLPTRTWYQNRTTLVHLHNMALNRAFFYSYIFQQLNQTEEFRHQPNWQYFYMSAVADVNANPNMINGSAVFFDYNCTYANWFTTLPFNETLLLFAAKAWRWDDYRDPDNWLREPTKKVAMVRDIGAGYGSNYTHEAFKMNPWYTDKKDGLRWLPDKADTIDTITKFTYSIGIKYSNETGKFVKDEYEAMPFFGPAAPGALSEGVALPVLFTRPYYDCGQANKWIVSAYSPIAEFMPRYSNFTHLRRARFTAMVVMDTDFNKLDFNACPVSTGNPGPSYLSGIDRCKTKTTMCKHKMGFGFNRGGYVCICRPGYRYPHYMAPPYQGLEMESATEYEHNNSFHCYSVQWAQILPNVEQDRNVIMRQVSRLKRAYLSDHVTSRKLKSINETDTVIGPHKKYSPRYMPSHIRVGRPVTSVEDVGHYQVVYTNQLVYHLGEDHDDDSNLSWKASRRVRRKRSPFDVIKRSRMERIFRQKKSVSASNCHQRAEHELYLPGDVAYGVDTQFEAEARTALRLAHFLSNYLQNVSPGETFGDMKGANRLHYDHLFGEVVANIMANYRIENSGIFYDKYMFENQNGSVREYFGPYAYRSPDFDYKAFDSAGLPDPYTRKEWFVLQKQRWKTNFEGLTKYKMRPYVRSNINGTSSTRFEYFPLSYKAPDLKHGKWSRPYFKCDGLTDAWVMTFSVPFFGMNRLRTKLLFKGVVTVDVKLDHLDIYQCPQPIHVANAFKNTARCDGLTTVCAQIKGLKFIGGGYRCNCAQGYEYGHRDKKMWIEGQLLESEYDKKVNGKFSRFDSLKCRVSGATVISLHNILITLTILGILFHVKGPN